MKSPTKPRNVKNLSKSRPIAGKKIGTGSGRPQMTKTSHKNGC